VVAPRSAVGATGCRGQRLVRITPARVLAEDGITTEPGFVARGSARSVVA